MDTEHLRTKIQIHESVSSKLCARKSAGVDVAEQWGAVVDTVKNLSDTVCLSNDDVEKITTKLMDREAEKTQLREHINEIHEVKVNKQQKLTSGICPKCGSELIFRNGKYGKFYGCSGYPKCRFTAPVD